jgi:hypothetical protein
VIDDVKPLVWPGGFAEEYVKYEPGGGSNDGSRVGLPA